jgi:aspartate racemase
MKTIGLLGGMSWESTATYYKLINEGVKRKLGGLHSAKIALYSVNFAEIEILQQRGDWDTATEILVDGAKKVAHAGADCLLICTNTMHKVAGAVAASVTIPLLHIADATALQLKNQSITTVGLLGTRFTMEQDFYRGRLLAHGLNVIVPEQDKRAIVHTVIYEELCKGVIREESRQAYLTIAEELTAQGAQGIILGCTEIGMLLNEAHSAMRLYDTTRIHAEAAVDFALM